MSSETPPNHPAYDLVANMMRSGASASTTLWRAACVPNLGVWENTWGIPIGTGFFTCPPNSDAAFDDVVNYNEDYILDGWTDPAYQRSALYPGRNTAVVMDVTSWKIEFRITGFWRSTTCEVGTFNLTTNNLPYPGGLTRQQVADQNLVPIFGNYGMFAPGFGNFSGTVTLGTGLT